MPRIATMYSRLRRASDSPWMSRAGLSQANAPMMSTNKGTVGVTSVAMSMKRNKAGIAMSESTIRIIAASNHPPTNPAVAPQIVPMVVARMPAARPTMMDVWPPSMSRPSWS